MYFGEKEKKEFCIENRELKTESEVLFAMVIGFAVAIPREHVEELLHLYPNDIFLIFIQ